MLSRCKKKKRAAAHLDSGLVELGHAGQLLTAVDVRVVRLGKGVLQLPQLLLSEGGAVAPPGGRGAGAGAGGVALTGRRGALSAGGQGGGGGEGQRHGAGALRLDLLEGALLTCHVQRPVRHHHRHTSQTPLSDITTSKPVRHHH